MSNRSKLVVSGVVVGLAALLAGTAHGGNAPVPTAQYYSVVLNAWDYVHYTGASQTSVMLVDDISFSARIPDENATLAEPPPHGFQPGGQAPLPVVGGNPVPRIAAFAQIWGLARAKSYDAEVWEIDGLGTRVRQIDQFSHTTHNEIASTFNGGRIPGPRDILFLGGLPPNPIGEDGPDMQPNHFAMTAWAVETSQSRHYQSPHIVPHGNAVSLEHPANVSAYRRYLGPMVFVKGRIIEDGALAPMEGSYAVNNLGIQGR